MGLTRALVSVADKAGIADFCRFLVDQDIEVISTGGTAKHLRENGVPVSMVEDEVGFPHLLGGRVKTLAPQIHAGILAKRDDANHIEELAAAGIRPIDLVAVDLYPFEKALREGEGLGRLVEEIDIGGITLLRGAAKNHEHVVVASRPAHYALIRAAMESNGLGGVPLSLRRRLAKEAFQETSRYDALIMDGLGSAFYRDDPSRNQGLDAWPTHLTLPLDKIQDLRYGENHHQNAAFYRDRSHAHVGEVGMANASQLQGKQLSYNNILDGDVVMSAVREFADPTVVIVKHATPSGVASADTLRDAWDAAYATDTYSPFGGIVGVNRALDADAAEAMAGLFLELILAPSFTPAARAVFKRKKNLRLLEVPGLDRPYADDADHAGMRKLVYRSVAGGLIAQERDLRPFDQEQWKVVTARVPTPEERRTMLFAARVVKHVKSNAVVFAKGTRTVGIGGGQTARVDASWIACHKGKDNINDSVMASDAFFPFRDAVDVAAENGVTAIVQPGGSIRDEEVFAAADEHGITMMTTDHRLFAH